MRTTDLLVHYKQIQYEFCSKGHVYFIQQQDEAKETPLYTNPNNGKILGPDESADYNQPIELQHSNNENILIQNV